MITPQERREAFKQEFKDLINKYNAEISIDWTQEFGDYLAVFLPKVVDDNGNKIAPSVSFTFEINSI